MDPYLMVALAIYFGAMLCIGLYGFKESTGDIKGYILGGRNVGPQVTALSAGASDMSGWMLMGLPGAMFVLGYDTVMIAIGLLLGAMLNYILVAPRLRVYTQVANDALTLPDFFAKRFEEEKGSLRLITAAVTIIFFTLYTSAGLVGGGKLFESVFGVNYLLGVMITGGVVVAYTLLGGFLAVSITDFVQGCIMFLALVIVPVVAFGELNGSAELSRITSAEIGTVSGTLSDMTLLAAVSALAWGLGYFGQPHILVRFMAIRSVKDIKTAAGIGLSWMTVSLIGAVATGLVGVAYVKKYQYGLDDPETIFIEFSQVLFHPLVSGFLLAAILAAIMSTISSQLLVSSSSLTEDFYKIFVNRAPTQKRSVMIGRIAVVCVAVVAMWLASSPDSSILSLVSNAWAGFGAAFGPLVLLSLFWKHITRAGAISGVIVGAGTVLFWIYAPITWNGESLSSQLYEIVPGFILSTLAIVVVSKLTEAPKAGVKETFIEAQEVLQASS